MPEKPSFTGRPGGTEFEDDEDGTEVHLNDDDILQEIPIDEEELPDFDPEDGEEGEAEMLETEDDGGEEDDSSHTFTGHGDPVYAVACSPTQPGLVSTGGGDDKAFIWKIGQADSPLELKGHSDSVASLAFSSDGFYLASGGLDGIVNVWEASTGSLKNRLEGPGGDIEWLRWHPRGHLVLAGSADYTAWLWNADSSACLHVLSGHRGPVSCGAFTPDGKTILTGSGDGSLRVWNPRTGQATHVVEDHPYHVEGLTCMSINAESTVAVTGSTDSSVCIVNIQNGKVAGTLAGHDKSVECVGLSSRLPITATGGMDGNLIIWDLQTLSSRNICRHEDGVIKLLWLQSPSLILTACLDGKVRVWDDRTGTCERTFSGHGDSIRDISVTPDCRFILSGSEDGTARAFELRR